MPGRPGGVGGIPNPDVLLVPRAMSPGGRKLSLERVPMPTTSLAEAVRALTGKVEGMDSDDLRDAHNELFPATPLQSIDSKGEETSIRQKLIVYLRDDIAVEEVLDLWGIIFPEARSVYQDDETRMIHFLVDPEVVRRAD